MSHTDRSDSITVLLDIGSSTSKILAYKVYNGRSGRPRIIYICRVHACGYYSNRSAHMTKHYSKMHPTTHLESDSKQMCSENEPRVALMSQRLQLHLKKHKPKLEQDYSGYLKEGEQKCTNELSTNSVHQETINQLAHNLAKLNLSVDQEDLPGVIRTLELKVYNINDGNISEYNPLLQGQCPHYLDGEKCVLHKEGSTERARCFDIDSPFTLSIPSYSCSVHKARFNLLKILPPDCYSFPSLVILPQTVITQAFLNHIFNLAPTHYFNFSKMLTTIQTTWMSNFHARLQHVIAFKVKSETEGRADIAKINEMTKTTANFLEQLYFLAHREVKTLMKEQLLALRQQTGTVLRIDHTYKVVKNLSAYSHDDSKRVQIKASLFTVLNENGQVLKSKIVPSDERKHVSTVLQKIWDTPGRSAITSHVFTDNSVIDKKTVKSTWLKSSQKAKPNPLVNQDLWHALHRIEQVMNSKHPDFHKARKQLADTLNEATSPEQLKLKLFGWSSHFGVLQSSSADATIKRLAAKYATTRGARKKKIGQLDIEEQHCAPIVNSRVQHAVNNLANNYAADILPSSSLPEGIKQGTSANEAWHKYLSKNFVQDSGSVSMELATAVIGHLQFLYNNSNNKESNTLGSYINFNVRTVLSTSLAFTHKSAIDIEQLGFHLKQMNWLKPRAPDIELCKKYLEQIHTEQHGIGISLLFYLSHYKFENAYCKGYVKKLLAELDQ